MLCGVTFNIGRLRKVGEPTTAAWNGSADDGRPVSYVDNQDSSGSNKCGPETGCYLVEREATDETSILARDEQQHRAKEEEWKKEVEMCVDDEDDPTYQYASDSSDEADEYVSNVGDEETNKSDLEMEDYGDDPKIAHDLYEDWRNGIDPPPQGRTQKPENFQPVTKPAKRNVQAPYNDCVDVDLEHIAGPNCQNRGGYNPFEISAEEMRGCKTIQCLCMKDQHWRPAPDDEDFEVSSKYFLTGLSDHMPSRDVASPGLFPSRHSLDSPMVDVMVMDPGIDAAVPFHPACFEIYKQMSRRHFGEVNVNGLMGWFNVESRIGLGLYDFSRHEDVTTASEQWWRHYRGGEYLAANPVFVPGLNDLLRPAISTDPSFSAEKGAFSSNLHQAKSGTASSNDPFLRLPQELKFYILNHLSSPDIAHLRLSSRAFYQLPISFWHRLLLEEMPWLYEVYATSAPSSWARVTASQLKARQEAKNAHAAQLQGYRDVIGQEMPEILEAWERAEPAFEEVAAAAGGPLEIPELPVLLPKDRTNWYLVYRNVAVHGKRMKGLRNRRRIWTDVEEIVRRIERYRGEGKIVD